MKTMNKFAKFLKAVGRKLSSAITETMTDQSLSISLDNYYTKKYNNCDNFKWHKAHPLSGAKFSRRGLSPTAIPNAIISKITEKFKINGLFQKVKNNFIAQKDGAKKLRSDYFFIMTLIFRRKRLNFRYNKNIGLLCCFITNPFWTNLPKLFCSFGNLIIQSFVFNTLKNAVKSMLLPFVVLGLFVNLAFADENTNFSQNITTTPESITQEMSRIFVNPDPLSATITSGNCEFKCRDVKDNYVTQINGFDFANGITYCEIFDKKDLLNPLKYNANIVNNVCINQWIKTVPTKAQYAKNDLKSNIKSQITQTTSDKEITLSKFLAGIVTLDPKIINRDSTNMSGQIVLANGVTTRSGGVSGLYNYANENSNSFFKRNISSHIPNFLKEFIGVDKDLELFNGENISVADGFNKANLAFFSNLFENMNEVYQHLQWLLFVVVGSFFLISIGTAKFQRYLENNGEANSNQPYLHKFMIPLITIGFFFMPIPEGNSKNDQATMVQNIIRYFTAKATDIADIASAKGGATYMNKIYASVGGMSEETEMLYQLNLVKANFVKEKAIKNYEEKCSTRFADFVSLGIPFAKMSEQEFNEYFKEMKNIDINQASGTSNDIKFEACIALEQTIWEANSDIKKATEYLQGIKNYYTNNKLQDNLKSIDNFLVNREKELGWFNSAIIASSGTMVELQSFITDNQLQKKDSIKTNTQKNQEAIKDNEKRGTTQAIIDSWDNISEAGKGMLMGQLAWFIIPGAGQIYNIIKENITFIGTAFGSALGSSSANPLGTLVGGFIGTIIGKTASAVAGSLIAFLTTPLIIEGMITKVPTLAIAVAGMIAVASYLVALCKYFYLSPFVVAFSLTTKRLDKIVNFLVTGITIFFKPVLIVLFIYLALFLNVLINELFVFMSIEQFGAIPVSAQDFWASFSIAGIKAMLKIFAILASTYIVWKLVISGPDWAMKLVGIDNSSDNMISQSLTQNLEKRSFMA